VEPSLADQARLSCPSGARSCSVSEGRRWPPPSRCPYGAATAPLPPTPLAPPRRRGGGGVAEVLRQRGLRALSHAASPQSRLLRCGCGRPRLCPRRKRPCRAGGGVSHAAGARGAPDLRGLGAPELLHKGRSLLEHGASHLLGLPRPLERELFIALRLGAGTERSAAHAGCASTGLGWLPSWRQRYPGHTCVAQLSLNAREWVAAVCPLPHTQCAHCLAGDAGCCWSVPGQKPRGAALTFICSVFLRRRRTFSGTTACPRTVSVLGLGDMALSAPWGTADTGGLGFT
jgi:hypothetical protein